MGQQTEHAKIYSDPVVQHVLTCAKKFHINKTYLYGSRAKGTAHAKSDYDFAFKLPPGDFPWGSFCDELREGNPTLFQLDLVRLDEISADFRGKILREGILLHE